MFFFLQILESKLSIHVRIYACFLSFAYIWIAVEMAVIKRGGDCGPINRFNSATMLCLSQARTLISNVICRGLFEVYWVRIRWEMIVRFVYIGWIDDSDYAHIWTKISTRKGNPNVDQLSCHSFVTHHEIMPTFEPRSIPEGAWPNHDQLSCHSFLNHQQIMPRGGGGGVTFVDLLKELPHKGGSGCNRHWISKIAWFFVFSLLLFMFVCPSVTSLFVAHLPILS